MKERITALISFVGSIGWGLFVLYNIAKRGLYDVDDFLINFSLLALSLSSFLYIVWTKFGKKELSEVEKMDIENQLLKRQIEQKELKKKLED
jgi:amino acid permease